MGLKDYKRKRHFDITSEPKGEITSSESGRLYVIHKHAASRLHYDLRLELDGVLKSWAVPKGPSLNPSEKHLAVHVEDHPVSYGDFEGIIPEGEYGGGTVMLWDKGEWEPIGDPKAGFDKGDFKFRLKGRKLKGLWVLARMADKDTEKGKNWLLIKKKDEYADPGGNILDQEPLSAASGRSMDEIARERDRIWSSLEPDGGAGQSHEKMPENFDPDEIAAVPGARPAAFPSMVSPQLATLVKEAPVGDDWIHEIKYDGYRILGFKKAREIRLMSRNGKDWTHKFSSLQKAMLSLPATDAVIDGEIVVKKSDGTTDFQALQNFLKGIGSDRLFYYAFDLLYLNGFDLAQTPLIHRKALLEKMTANPDSDAMIRFSDHIIGRGPAVYHQACRHALEGMISKRINSLYRQERTKDWVKVKCMQRQEFVIAGFSRPGGTRTGFGALLLGYYDSSGKLLYAGRVGTGFTDMTLRSILNALSGLLRKTSPLHNPPKGTAVKGVEWVEPQKVAEIEFIQWTEEGSLRHPSFKGIREDKDPREVVREQPVQNRSVTRPPREEAQTESTRPDPEKKPSSGKPAAGGPVEFAGVRLTNPHRILYQAQGITKAALAEFYARIGEKLLPYIDQRPLTIVRCPQGQQKKCFYQKHLTDQLPDSIKGIPIKEKNKEEIYIMAEDVKGIVSLVQLGVLEFHPWGSRVERLEYPDMMIFDLDPGPGIDPLQLVEGCRMLKMRLDELGLKSFIKTSGGKGFHIIVPIIPENDWDDVKAFSGAVAKSLVRDYPARFIAVMTKAKRNNKIFLDYLRNGRGATSVAPFSTRARSGAPVSTPIAWDELDETLKPDAYTVENLPHRLESLRRDPWADFFRVHQSITAETKNHLSTLLHGPLL